MSAIRKNSLYYTSTYNYILYIHRWSHNNWLNPHRQFLLTAPIATERVNMNHPPHRYGLTDGKSNISEVKPKRNERIEIERENNRHNHHS